MIMRFNNIHIDVKDDTFYDDIINNGVLGVADAYLDSKWIPKSDLSDIFIKSMNSQSIMRFLELFNDENKEETFLNDTKNTIDGSTKNISYHYDLSNDFFLFFLDSKHRMYSSGYYKNDFNILSEAQENKLELICEKLNLNENDSLLEIGSGWGGLSIYAAKKYNCKVKTITISKEQYDYCTDRINRENLSHLIDIELIDYRELTGKYDKVVLLEVIEHIGYENYSTFFNKMNSLLNDNGVMVQQIITIDDNKFTKYKDSCDFIKKYIFPGGCLTSVKYTLSKSNDSNFEFCNSIDLTESYVKTLDEWNYFMVNSNFDMKLKLLFHYYFMYCIAGFKTRNIENKIMTWRKIKDV